MASLLYGSGLRLVECCQLRVKDVDLGRRQIMVRDGKGRKDRVTVLPASLAPALTSHLACVRRQHQAVREAGYDIRTIQERLGHRDVSTTMVYTHVLNRGGLGIRSPLD